MKMTAAVLHEQGLPHPFTVSKPMRIEQVELTAPGPGEVLIQVAAAGLCHSDLSTIEGVRPRKLPTVVGHEGAGIVVELGAGVKDVKVGDHVVTSFVSSCGNCRYCSDARPHLCTVSTASRANGRWQKPTASRRNWNRLRKRSSRALAGWSAIWRIRRNLRRGQGGSAGRAHDRSGRDDRVLLRRRARPAIMQMDNEPYYKGMLQQYPIPGVK